MWDASHPDVKSGTRTNAAGNKEHDQNRRTAGPARSGRADPKEIFAWLFDEYAPPLRGYLAGRVGVHAADDLVTETFVVALRRRAGYDPRLALRHATNLLRNHVRQEVRGFELTAKGGAEHLPAGELAGLSEQDRDVLLLTSWAGLEPAEVAEALGVPAGTVRSRLHPRPPPSPDPLVPPGRTRMNELDETPEQLHRAARRTAVADRIGVAPAK
ncbi:MAG: hypothetical protein QOI78_6681 [Actinomycetota bacterium]|jgi:RNA polymerase sigma-70 factor (ECF subfamily)|nr:hypothetical protein [Actinomycetota bacterium]